MAVQEGGELGHHLSFTTLLCTSATLNVGVQQLLDALQNFVPSPAERPFAANVYLLVKFDYTVSISQ